MIEARIDAAAAAPAFHGGPPAFHADDAPVLLDFSTNINAFGPPPDVLNAIAAADPAAYPDPTAKAPRQAFAHWCGLPVDQVALTAGACDAVDRIARAFLGPRDTVLVAAPAFAEYARAAAIAGATVREVREPSRTADPDLDQILAAMRELRPRLLFLAAPSSPLGAARPAQEIAALADSIHGHGLLVLDESYAAFESGVAKPPLCAERNDVVHVRSITKDFALAGVRAGFVIARSDIIRAIQLAGPPWAVSAAAQAAAAAAFTPRALEHVSRTIRTLRSERGRLAQALGAHGAVPLPGDTHVLCLRVDGAEAVAARLLRHGIRVRPCRSFGWPGVVRIAPRTPRENNVVIDRFVEALC